MSFAAHARLATPAYREVSPLPKQCAKAARIAKNPPRPSPCPTVAATRPSMC